MDGCAAATDPPCPNGHGSSGKAAPRIGFVMSMAGSVDWPLRALIPVVQYLQRAGGCGAGLATMLMDAAQSFGQCCTQPR